MTRMTTHPVTSSPSYQLGNALGALASRVVAQNPETLAEELDRLPDTLFDLAACSHFFARLCERALNDPRIAIDDGMCEQVAAAFILVKNMGEGHQSYQL